MVGEGAANAAETAGFLVAAGDPADLAGTVALHDLDTELILEALPIPAL